MTTKADVDQTIFGKPEFNAARLEHLAALGLDLEHKTVLEVGAGVGELTGFFEELGCDVYSTEGDPRYAEIFLERHPHRKGRIEVVNLEVPGSHDHLGPFDIVFCYGVLYHVARPSRILEDLARVCRSLFLLSTRIAGQYEGKLALALHPKQDKGSIAGRGYRPSRDWVMDELQKNYEYVYVTVSQPDRREYSLTWPVKGRVRSVFVGSREELMLPTLSNTLLETQERLGWNGHSSQAARGLSGAI